MKNNIKSVKTFSLLSILALFAAFSTISCDFDNLKFSGNSGNNPNDNQNKITVESTEGKLTITGLDAFNDFYVVAFGHNWNYEYLYAAENIDSQFVFTGGKIKENKVVLNIWKDDFDGTLIDYKDTGNFTFLVYVLNKREFKKAEEFIIGDYYYKGKPKPGWLEIIGLIRGSTNIDGICEAEFTEMEPL
ncbi:MAG: hypothetical protein FWC01_02620 [Treponema sp.]|nr:hypothetical protein [Treponema sp.]MCL2237132.1 hypothetical protein [Treponema sp.]